MRYLADAWTTGVVFLADRLAKPVLVEGPAGTDKTQLAKSVAEITGSRFIRLQCYEGLDESRAPVRMELQEAAPPDPGPAGAEEAVGTSWPELEEDIFSDPDPQVVPA